MIIKFDREQFTKGYDLALIDLLAIGRGQSVAGRYCDLEPGDVFRWAKCAETDQVTVLDIVALGIALDFDREILAYGFAYGQTNRIQHLIWTSTELQASRLIDELFLAFDSSDFAETAHEREAIARENVAALLGKIWLPRWETS